MKCNCENCKGKEVDVEVLLYEAKVSLTEVTKKDKDNDTTELGVTFGTSGAVTMQLKEFITGEMFDGEETPLDELVMNAFISELKAMEQEYFDKVTKLIMKTTGDYSRAKYLASTLTGGLN